jgi:hypothetical protein
VDPEAGTAGKTRIANEIQLYRSAGFIEVLPRELPEGVAEALDTRGAPDPGSTRGRGPSDGPEGEEARAPLKARWMASPSPLTPRP